MEEDLVIRWLHGDGDITEPLISDVGGTSSSSAKFASPRCRSIIVGLC